MLIHMSEEERQRLSEKAKQERADAEQRHEDAQWAAYQSMAEQCNAFRAACDADPTARNSRQMSTVVTCFGLLIEGEFRFDRFFWACMDAVPRSAHRPMMHLYAEYCECRDAGGLHEKCVTRICMIGVALMLLMANAAVGPLPPMAIEAHPFHDARIEIADAARWGLIVETDGDLEGWDAQTYDWVQFENITVDDALRYMLSRTVDVVPPLVALFFEMYGAIMVHLTWHMPKSDHLVDPASSSESPESSSSE